MKVIAKRNEEIEESETTFTTQQLADALSLTPRRVQQLAKEGAVVSVSRGKYAAVESIRNYLQYVEDRDGGESNIDYLEEKAKHEKAKRQKAELELAVMKGEMHRSGDIKLVMNDMLAAFRSRVLAVPSKLAPQLVGKTEMPVILDILTQEVYEALRELSEYDPSKFYAMSEEYVELDEDEKE